MKTRFILGLLFLLGLYLIVSFSRDLWVLRQKEKEIIQSQLKLEKARVENEALKQELGHVQSEAFIEKEAREKLGMAKPGETVLFLPQEIEGIANFVSFGKNEEKELPNWQKWWKLFF